MSEKTEATQALTVAPQNSLFSVGDLMPAARENTRDVQGSLQTAIQIVTLDEESAKECFYTLPRGGKQISGPSIGLAETLASTWGNMIISCDHAEEHEDHIIVKGRVFDTQSGLGFEGSVRRRIVKKDGTRYNGDMITNTINAATSILYRNLVLRVIPRPYVRKVYRAACDMALGGGGWPERVAKQIAFWEGKGIPKARLLQHLGKLRPEDLEYGDIEYLLALDQNIKNGDITVEEAFAPPVQEAAAPPRQKRSRKATAEKTEPEPDKEPETAPEAPEPDPDDPGNAFGPLPDGEGGQGELPKT